MRAPANSPITMPFGSTDAPYSVANPHKGVDFSYIPDDVIYAPFAGIVNQLKNNGNDGNGTYMTDSEGRYHGFLHASKYLVQNGSNVVEGQPIAVMGDTGYVFGKHLHWAVRQNGVFINGMSLIKEEPVGKWNNGDTYNLLFHSCNAAIAKRAQDANYVGYFGLQDGMDAKIAFNDIISSPQYDFLVDEARKATQVPSEYEPITEQLFKKKG